MLPTITTEILDSETETQTKSNFYNLAAGSQADNRYVKFAGPMTESSSINHDYLQR